MKKRLILFSFILVVLASISLYIRHVNAQSCTTQQLTLCTSGDMNSNGPVSITVSSGGPLFQIATLTCPGGVNGSSYSCTPSVLNGVGPFNWSIFTGTIPCGTTLNTATGAITGTINCTGNFNWEWMVLDTGASKTATNNQNNVQMVNTIAPVVITSGLAPDDQVGTPYPAFSVVAQGGTGIGFVYGTSGTLFPTGLTLNPSTGAVTGTPTQVGTYSFNFTAHDSLNNQATPQANVVQITAIPPPCTVTISPSSPTVLQVNSTQQFTAVISNCTTNQIQWSVNGVNGGNSTFGTITVGGLYTAPATVPSPSTFNVTATSVSNPTVSSSDSVTIIPITQQSQENQYCALGDVPLFQNDSYAAKITHCIYTGLDGTPSNGTVHTVNNITDWNAIWNAFGTTLKCGDVIQVTAGTTLNNVTVPANITCNAQAWITVRPSTYASLPAEHNRISACYAGKTNATLGSEYPTFSCPNGSTDRMFHIVDATANGPSNFAWQFGANDQFIRIIGAEITRLAGTGNRTALVKNSAGGIRHIIWDRSWLHGTGTDEMTRSMNVDHVQDYAVINSWATDFLCISVVGTCTEAQAFGGGINTNNLEQDFAIKFYNNFTMAGGETLAEFGGGGAAITPTDIEIRNNFIYEPPQWNPSSPLYAGGIGSTGHAPTAKNWLEFKNANRVLVEGNYFQHMWGGFTQAGPGIDIGPKNQNCNAPVATVQNIIVRYNYLNEMGQPFQLTAQGSDTGCLGTAAGFDSIHDNVWDGINYSTCNSCGTSATPYQYATAVNATGQFILNHINTSNNTFVWPNGAPLSSANIGLSGPNSSQSAFQNTIDNDNNIYLQMNSSTLNSFGGCTSTSTNCACNGATSQTQGLAMINACLVPNTFSGNIVVNGTSAKNWPSGTCLSETTQASLYVNWNNGDGLGGGTDYHVKPTSPCFHAGIGSTTPGANIDEVLQMISGVNNL